MKDDLKNAIEEAKETAIDLGYGEETINKLEKARNVDHLYNLMAEARHSM